MLQQALSTTELRVVVSPEVLKLNNLNSSLERVPADFPPEILEPLLFPASPTENCHTRPSTGRMPRYDPDFEEERCTEQYLSGLICALFTAYQLKQQPSPGRARSASLAVRFQQKTAGPTGFRIRREPLGAPEEQTCAGRARLEADRCILATAGGPKN